MLVELYPNNPENVFILKRTSQLCPIQHKVAIGNDFNPPILVFNIIQYRGVPRGFGQTISEDRFNGQQLNLLGLNNYKLCVLCLWRNSIFFTSIQFWSRDIQYVALVPPTDQFVPPSERWLCLGTTIVLKVAHIQNLVWECGSTQGLSGTDATQSKLLVICSELQLIKPKNKQ